MLNAAHALLETSQQRLEALYGLHPAPSPLGFLTASTSEASHTEEQLLIQHDEENDELGLGLYLAPALLKRLQARSMASLHDIAMAIEGISHLRYVIHRASDALPLTPLELELQAEVDKFALLIGTGPNSPQLRQHLFHCQRLRKGMGVRLRERYQESTRLAARYCKYLERRYLSCNAFENLLAELRLFYRMGQHAKIAHIDAVKPF
jgi:hypothetical protein